MIEERDEERLWKFFGIVVGGALVCAADQLRRGVLPVRKKVQEDPDIAKPGEKVIALEDIDGGGVNDYIRQGDIYTVSRYSGGYYYFKECGAVYNPYLGEDASQVFNAKKFKRLEP